jgi:hypothetical protein
VKRLVAAGAQDRLAQPLEAEREEQGADDEPQCPDRDVLKRRAEGRDDRSEHEARGADAKEGRAPAADDPDGKHDRERLDRLDGTGEERGEKEKNVVGHGGCVP